MDPLVTKVTVLGEPQSGKSSLVQRYFNDAFSDDYTPTEAMEFLIRVLDVDGRRVSLQCHDLTGHVLNPGEKSAAKAVRPWIESAVLRRSCVMLAYDVADPASLNKLTDWVKHVKKAWATDGNYNIGMVVACKCDLALTGSLDAGRAFAEKNGFLFIDTSALTEYNVAEAFQHVTEAYIRGILESTSSNKA